MPLCQLRTNMKRSELDANIEELMAKGLSEIFGVPLEILFVFVQCEIPAFFGGSRDPGMVCELSAKKYLYDEEVVKTQYMPKLIKLIQDITKLPGKRVVISLAPVPDHLAGMGN